MYLSAHLLRRVVLTSSPCLLSKISSSRSSGNLLYRSASTVAFSSISDEDRGHAILLSQATLPPGSPKTPHDVLSRVVFGAKILSLSSSVAGVVMVPVLSSYLWDAAAERPTMMMFAIVANTVLVALSFTPLLLNILTKRFPIQIYYNHSKKQFTFAYYDFFLRKRARVFSADEIQDPQTAQVKLMIPLATALLEKTPLLISLDRNAYVDKLAFDELTKNIDIPPNAD